MRLLRRGRAGRQRTPRTQPSSCSTEGSSGGDRVRASRAVPGDTFATVPLEISTRGGGDLLGGGDVPPDALDGGPGRDTVTYGAALESVAGKINGQIYENNTGTGLDTLTAIETLIGS